MSTITAVVKDVVGRPDNTAWVFSSVLRESSDGDIVTTRRKSVKPVAGELSVDLDPGFAIIEYGGATYFVTIPDTDTDLWTLLSAAVGVPVTTPADLLAAAVETFVESNPGYPWSGISGKPDVDAKDAATLTTATGRAIAFAIALG